MTSLGHNNPPKDRTFKKRWAAAIFACEDAAEFDSYRLATDLRSFRISPRIPGLTLVKSAILFAYGWHLISVRSAQRLVDLSKCWEA